MKSSLFNFYLLLLAFSSAAQSRSGDYNLYFDGILKAEEQIAQKNLANALKLYAGAFKPHSFVFPRDAFNACQVAVLTKNCALIDTMLFRCALSGVPEKVINGNSLITGAYSSDTERFRQLYTAGEQIYLARINKSLRREFQQRYRLEQENKGTATHKDICADNFQRILELAKSNQFPGEQLIGVNDNLENARVSATLKHSPYSYTALLPYLPDALRKGEIQPLWLMYIYGFSQSRTSVLYTNRTPVDTVNFKDHYNLAFGIKSTDTIAVNKARKKAGLHSMEMQQKILDQATIYGIDFRMGY